MRLQKNANQDAIDAVVRLLASCAYSPLRFVEKCFPWGVAGGPLANDSIRAWQRAELDAIGVALRAQRDGGQFEPIQDATASGHGIGKSAEVAWLTLWALCTFVDSRGVVTANTENQLRTKTWPELAKWHAMLIPEIRQMFEVTATSIFSRDPEHSKTWKIDAVPWSETNTEAFQGLHNLGKRILVQFDEASGIADKIWEVTEGALTDANTEILWLVKGNPTKTVGRFRDCFGRLKHRWNNKSIDSRTVEGTNKVLFQKWADDYGEDSDFVRIRVRGMFPRASAMQFIETDTAETAARREPLAGLRDPLIMAIDVARGGTAEFVISYRRGQDAKSIPWIIIPGSETRDSTKVIAKIIDLAQVNDRLLRPDAIMVDETGVGGPIVDRLRQLLGEAIPVYGCQFGGDSPDPKMANMRMYIWSRMRDWLRLGGAIPDDPHLIRQLTEPEYSHDKKDRMLLESKESMEDRNLESPDRADALAISFTIHVEPRSNTNLLATKGKAVTEYDPHA